MDELKGLIFNPNGKILAVVRRSSNLYFIRALDGILITGRYYGASQSGD